MIPNDIEVSFSTAAFDWEEKKRFGIEICPGRVSDASFWEPIDVVRACRIEDNRKIFFPFCVQRHSCLEAKKKENESIKETKNEGTSHEIGELTA